MSHPPSKHQDDLQWLLIIVTIVTILCNYSYSDHNQVDLQYLAVSHTGVKLIRREKSLPTDYLKVRFLAQEFESINVQCIV